MKKTILIFTAVLVIALVFASSALAVKGYKDAVAPDSNNGHGNDRDHCDESNPSGNCPHKVSEPSFYIMIEEQPPLVCGTGLYC